MGYLAADSDVGVGGAEKRVYTEWDAEKHQVCKCDPYWEGIDCSLRMCPKGDDPLTLGSNNEIQELALTGTAAGSFTLTYTDQFNGLWTTRPIKLKASPSDEDKARTVTDIQEALNGLPNEVIQGLKVEKVAANSYALKFSGAFNSGDQHLLKCNVAGCETNGCQPNYAGWAGTCAITTPTPGTTEKAVCSNRGNCDATTGQCACFSGYYGEACEQQTALF